MGGVDPAGAVRPRWVCGCTRWVERVCVGLDWSAELRRLMRAGWLAPGPARARDGWMGSSRVHGLIEPAGFGGGLRRDAGEMDGWMDGWWDGASAQEGVTKRRAAGPRGSARDGWLGRRWVAPSAPKATPASHIYPSIHLTRGTGRGGGKSKNRVWELGQAQAATGEMARWVPAGTQLHPGYPSIHPSIPIWTGVDHWGMHWAQRS